MAATPIAKMEPFALRIRSIIAAAVCVSSFVLFGF